MGLSFSFFNFPRREGNGIRINFMLSVFHFSIALKKRILIFFFVFRFRIFGKRITSRFLFDKKPAEKVPILI